LEAKLKPLCYNVFMNYFKENKLSLIKTKKDMCDTCLAYRVGNLTEEAFNQHLAQKDAALNEKQNDKENTPKTTLVCTEDTEALLLAPCNKSSAMFYRTKLNCHNLTYYNLKTKKVLNYLWTETTGGLESSVFTSIHVDFITKSLEEDPDITDVIILSDGCIYQNKNDTESSAIRRIAAKYKVTITWKYLEVGHTYMECDSAHRCI
jgi:hypothetical protein